MPDKLRCPGVHVSKGSGAGDGNKCNGRDGTDFKAAQVRFAAEEEPLERRSDKTVVAGHERAHEMKSEHITLVIDGMKILGLHNVVQGFDVAAEPLDLEGIEQGFSGGRVHGVVDRAVSKRRHDVTGVDAGEGGRAAQGLELQDLEQVGRSGAIGGDVCMRITVRQS